MVSTDRVIVERVWSVKIGLWSVQTVRVMVSTSVQIG